MTTADAPGGETTAAGLSGFDEETTTVRGDQIHYLVGGDGERTFVLLHGGIIDAAHVTWRPLLEPLAREATVYAPNLPGYGPSPMPDAPLTIGRHVETTAAFLEHLDVENSIVAGISMGGGVAVGLGLEYREHVERLVALDAMALGSTLSSGLLTWVLAKIQVTNNLSVALMRRSRSYTRAGLEQLFSDSSTVPEPLVDLVYEEVKRPDAGAAFRSFRANEVTRDGYRTDYTERLPDLDVPVDLVHGSDDTVIPPAWSQRADDRLPDSTLTMLSDCGHLPTWERTDAVATLCLDGR